MHKALQHFTDCYFWWYTKSVTVKTWCFTKCNVFSHKWQISMRERECVCDWEILVFSGFSFKWNRRINWNSWSFSLIEHCSDQRVWRWLNRFWMWSLKGEHVCSLWAVAESLSPLPSPLSLSCCWLLSWILSDMCPHQTKHFYTETQSVNRWWQQQQ